MKNATILEPPSPTFCGILYMMSYSINLMVRRNHRSKFVPAVSCFPINYVLGVLIAASTSSILSEAVIDTLRCPIVDYTIDTLRSTPIPRETVARISLTHPVGETTCTCRLLSITFVTLRGIHAELSVVIHMWCLRWIV